MILKKILVCNIAVLFLESVDCLERDSPELYDLAPCYIDDSFHVFVGITVPACMEVCRRRTFCTVINYNRYNKLCALRHSSDMDLGGLETRWCYSLVMSNQTIELQGPCHDTPCDEMSVCEDSAEMPFYTCTLEYCRSETEVIHASYRIKVPINVGRRNELTCDEGYTPSERGSVTCLPDGNWSPTDLQCLKTCPSIPLTPTAHVSSWSTYRFVVNTTASYTCNEWFYNITARVVGCDSSGEWSTFKCLPFCRLDDIPTLEKGHPIPGDNYTIYTTAEYVCDTGYYFSSGSRVVSCDHDGAWSHPQVECFQFCKQENIPPVENGKPLNGSLYNHTMQAQYTCNTGYYLSENSPNIVCDTCGDWSSPQIHCYPYCQLPAPLHGNIQAADTEPIKKDVEIEFTCDGGYYSHPFGTVEIATCQLSGQWIYSVNCYKYCGGAPGISYGNVADYSTGSPYTVATSATYTCHSLLHISGGNSKKCSMDGSWSGGVHCCFACYEYSNKEKRCKYDTCFG